MKTTTVGGYTAIISLLALGGPMPQASAAEQFMSYGPLGGTASCGTYTKGDHETREAIRFWMFGFVTGVGYALPNGRTLAHSDTDGLTGWFDSYCAAHPLDTTVRAGIELVKELEGRARPVR